MMNMPRIALTGGIACGKSLLAKYLNEFGIETLDADDVAHGLVPAEERSGPADAENAPSRFLMIGCSRASSSLRLEGFANTSPAIRRRSSMCAKVVLIKS